MRRGAIYRSDFIFHGRGGHYPVPHQSVSKVVVFCKNHSLSIHELCCLCQVCEWEVAVDGAITELDAL